MEPKRSYTHPVEFFVTFSADLRHAGAERTVKSIFVCKFATAAFSYAASLSWRCSRAMTSRRGTTPCSSFTAGE